MMHAVYYELIKEDSRSGARLGKLHTPHGTFDTPMFMFTSLTTLFSVIAIFLYGGDTIHNFSFAMLVGISSGFYTSTFLAGPMWMFLKKSSQHSDGRVVRKTKVV